MPAQLPPFLIDSHCHFDFPEFAGQRDDILRQCVAQGVGAIIIPGVTANNWAAIHSLCEANPRLFPAFGLHPYFLDQHQPSDVQSLDLWLDQHPALAVGEVGLDLYSGNDTLEQQVTLFSAQVGVAKNHQLPLIVHSRKSYDLVVKYIKQSHFKYGGVVHAFAGSYQQAQHLIDLGFKLGFGGAVTYDRAKKLKATLKKLPAESIVLETDAPDMAPSFAQNKPNTPLNLPGIAQQVAVIRQVDVAQLIADCFQNAQALFQRDFTAKF